MHCYVRSHGNGVASDIATQVGRDLRRYDRCTRLPPKKRLLVLHPFHDQTLTLVHLACLGVRHGAFTVMTFVGTLQEHLVRHTYEACDISSARDTRNQWLVFAAVSLGINPNL